MSLEHSITEISAETKLAYSVSELTRLLSISRATAYQLIHREGFPTIRIGSRILIPKQGLEKWLAEQSSEVQA